MPNTIKRSVAFLFSSLSICIIALFFRLNISHTDFADSTFHLMNAFCRNADSQKTFCDQSKDATGKQIIRLNKFFGGESDYISKDMVLNSNNNIFSSKYSYNILYILQGKLAELIGPLAITVVPLFPISIVVLFFAIKFFSGDYLSYPIKTFITFFVLCSNPLFLSFFISGHPMSYSISLFFITFACIEFFFARVITDQKGHDKRTFQSEFRILLLCFAQLVFGRAQMVLAVLVMALFSYGIYKGKKVNTNIKRDRTEASNSFKRIRDFSFGIRVFRLFLISAFIILVILRIPIYFDQSEGRTSDVLRTVLDSLPSLYAGMFGGNVNYESTSYFANYSVASQSFLVNVLKFLFLLGFILASFKKFDFKFELILLLCFILSALIYYKWNFFYEYNIQYHHCATFYLIFGIFIINGLWREKGNNYVKTLLLVSTFFFSWQAHDLLENYSLATFILEKWFTPLFFTTYFLGVFAITMMADRKMVI